MDTPFGWWQRLGKRMERRGNNYGNTGSNEEERRNRPVEIPYIGCFSEVLRIILG